MGGFGLGNCKASQVIKNNRRLGPPKPLGIDQQLILMTWPTLQLPDIMSM